jgi:hypothetical protein
LVTHLVSIKNHRNVSIHESFQGPISGQLRFLGLTHPNPSLEEGVAKGTFVILSGSEESAFCGGAARDKQQILHYRSG